MYDYNNLKNIIIPAEFGVDSYGDITDSMEYVHDQLPQDIYTAFGATQFVIIDNEQDKVAKIGFTGEFWYDEDLDPDLENPIFDPFYTNYADYAYDLFTEAEEEGIDILFAKVELFGKTANGKNIYLQEKVISYDNCDGSNSKSSKRSKDSYEKMVKEDPRCGIRRFPEDWAIAVIEWYGEELIKNFLKFINKYGLDDWHDGNIGWRKDGSPCILDWAGFDN